MRPTYRKRKPTVNAAVEPPEAEAEEPGAGETSESAPPENEIAEAAAPPQLETGLEPEPEPGGATVVEHPVSIAPPHSLTPPPEEGADPAEEEVAVADDDGSEQRA